MSLPTQVDCQVSIITLYYRKIHIKTLDFILHHRLFCITFLKKRRLGNNYQNFPLVEDSM